jgi:hypothetical protein
VNTAVASVVTSIDGMGSAGRKRLEGLTATALDFAAAFEVDVVRATQVAGTVVSQGLAKDGTAAFDLLTEASSKVPVALREDLMDAVEEYGGFFDTLGYSGPQAFAMLVDASEKGIYGIDKAGDAVKEFTIRGTDMSKASKDAYAVIGLSAEEMADKLVRGGEDAREATGKVIDGLLAIESPSQRANTAIALFGTPIEDLNVRDIPEFLRNLKGTSDTMDDTAGAARRMGTDMNDNAKAKITGFTRTLKTNVIDWLANEAIPFLENDVAPAFGKISDALDDLPPWAVKGTVGGVLGLLAAGKIGGLVGNIRSLSGALGGGGRGGFGKAAPIPVFVVNNGIDGAVTGKKGWKSALKGAGWLGPVGAGVAIAASMSDEQRNHLAEQTTGAVGIGGGDIGGLAAEAQRFDELTRSADEARGSVGDLRTMLSDPLRILIDDASLRYALGLAQDYRSTLASLPALERGIVSSGMGSGRKMGGDTGIPRGATGGIVTQPTLAVIGEAGPEMVVPLNRTPGSRPLPGVGEGLDYDRLAQAIASTAGRFAPLMQNVTIQPHNYSEFKRQMLEDRRRASSGGYSFL